MTLLPMENKETILCALKCFEKEKSNNIPPILDDYIKQIAKNGQTMLPWIYVKPLMLCKYNKVMDGFLSEYTAEFMPVSPNPSAITELRQRVYSTLKRMDGIPFTIQRLCELLENPFKHYTRPDKFLRGLEKVLMVVSTVDPQGNKIHREDPRFPSQAGMDECSMIINDTMMSPPTSPQADNVNGPHTSKSSDEDITEDENGDENEDEDDEEDTEEDREESTEQIHADDLSARGDVNPTRTMPTLAKVGPAVSTWSGEGKCSTRLGLPIDPLVNSEDHVDDERNKDLNTIVAKPNTIVSSDRDSINLPAGTTLVSSDPALGPLDSGSPSADTLRKKRGEETSAGGEDDHTVDEHRLSGDSVPPIRQILRPIGQLEAFVQNISADAPNAPVTTSLSPSAKGLDPTNSGSLKATADESVTELAPSASGLCSPMTAQKRRAPVSPPSPSPTTSSDSMDANTDDSLDSSSNESPLSLESLKSPAKRRRLGNAHVPSQPPQHSSDSSASGPETPSPFPNSLNSSPPIILCNPSPTPSRDRESGECFSSSSLSNPSIHTDVSDAHIDEAQVPPVLSVRLLDEHLTESRSGATATSTVNSTVRIDLETGEEEQQMEQAADDEEDDHGIIEGEAAQASEIRSIESSSS